jgi:hypothetical protein
MSARTPAITVVAPEERFEEFIEETAPIIESIEPRWRLKRTRTGYA